MGAYTMITNIYHKENMTPKEEITYLKEELHLVKQVMEGQVQVIERQWHEKQELEKKSSEITSIVIYGVTK